MVTNQVEVCFVQCSGVVLFRLLLCSLDGVLQTACAGIGPFSKLWNEDYPGEVS